MGVDVVLKQVSQPGTSPKRRRLTQVDVVLDGSDLFARICESSDLPLLNLDLYPKAGRTMCE
jgi:hypothetical protein